MILQAQQQNQGHNVKFGVLDFGYFIKMQFFAFFSMQLFINSEFSTSTLFNSVYVYVRILKIVRSKQFNKN